MKKYFFALLCFLPSLLFSQDRTSSATKNVQIIDNPFDMPGLDRTRVVRLYLPNGYEASEKSYPVIYMHDGQNLFDNATSYVGEWGVDEVLNEIAQEGGPEFIVVGIDNGQEKRMNELSPWGNKKYGKAEGEAYMKFVVEVVKPLIDKNYRTKTEVENTAIIGSSMGGLISHYAIYQYPEVFGKAGIYSPSYWYAYNEVFDFTDNNPVPKMHKLDLLVGGKEGLIMVKPMEDMAAKILASGHDSEHIRSKVVADGEHNEKFWRSEFKETILWLFDKK